MAGHRQPKLIPIHRCFLSEAVNYKPLITLTILWVRTLKNGAQLNVVFVFDLSQRLCSFFTHNPQYQAIRPGRVMWTWIAKRHQSFKRL